MYLKAVDVVLYVVDGKGQRKTNKSTICTCNIILATYKRCKNIST